jgi:CDP-diacylglycerol--glycerol-3-phosphate 3-phosphatidyltransferase
VLNRLVEKQKKIKQDEQLKEVPDGRVFIFPSLQFNVIGFREDEVTFTELLKFFQTPGSGLQKLQLATGYLNLQKQYLKLINNLTAECNILTSSPRANSFYQAGRVKKFIPGLYRVNALNILKQNKKKGGNISVNEWSHGDWTFHGKGAWIYEEGSTVPQMTVIGSSNFSSRSNRRDTEAMLYIVPECENFKAKLHDECEHLFAKSNKMTTETILDKTN